MKNLIIFMTFMLFLSAFARNDLVPVFRLEIEYDDHHFSEIIYFYNDDSHESINSDLSEGKTCYGRNYIKL